MCRVWLSSGALERSQFICYEVNSYIFENHPDIVILNETWLSRVHKDNEIFLSSDYKIFRQDRTRRTHPADPLNPKKFREKGGGVLIGVSTSLDAESARINVNAAAEIMTVSVKLPDGGCHYISTCYRVGVANEDTNLAIENYLAKVTKRRDCKKHTLIGDFNLNRVSWPEGNTTCQLQQQVLDTFHNFGLHQMIDKPTHKDGNTLDLLLTNVPNLAKNVVIHPRYEVCNSDHYAISFDLGPAKRKKFPKRKILNFKKANWDGLERDLNSVDWDSILKYCDAETAWQDFKKILLSLCEKHIPTITIQYKFQSPWYDSQAHKICQEKETLRTVFNNTKIPSDYTAFCNKRKEFRRCIEDKMRSHFEDSGDNSIITKKLWSLVKSASNSSRIPEMVSYKGKFRNNPTDQANLFNEFFCDQFSEISDYDLDIDFSNDENFNIEFDKNTVADLLRKTNAHKAQGPDGIHGHILKNCASSISYPLSLIFTTSYNIGQIPREWKLAHVVPVHKKGDKSLADNYRPISLTCLIMKIFEIQIRNNLMSRCHHLLDPRQHGFLPEKSCTTQLASYVDSLSQSINASSRSDVVFFDFMKAFDSVNHDIILSKLKHKYGIDGRLLKFMISYLQDRLQRVVINGCLSDAAVVSSGVPQGSILGPLLFVMFINDMFDCISSGTEIALYADDTKIWRRIDEWGDHLALQRDIDALHLWSVTKRMKFHPLKCKVVSVTLNRIGDYNDVPLPFCIFNYTLNGEILDFVDSEKDLGVLVTTKLSWHDQTMAVYSKASSRLGLVRRTCHFVQCPRQKCVLYLSLVRSLYEHASIIWRPCSDNLIGKLEKVQKRAVKWILSEQGHHYNEFEYFRRLQDLELLPIQSRFILNDLVFFHKIFYSYCPVAFPDYLKVAVQEDLSDDRLRSRIVPPDYLGAPIRNEFEELRASKLDLFSMICTIDIEKQIFRHSFFVRSHFMWNRLPLSLRSTSSHGVFKYKLIEHLWYLALSDLDFPGTEETG